jgi:short-subunit dehydrogenase
MKKDETVLITGASGGIGLELIKIFAKNGYDMVLVARSSDKLREVKDDLLSQFGVKVIILSKDLSNPKAPQEIYDELKKEAVNIDILVNNAGFGGAGKFSETSLNRELDMMTVNMTVPVMLTKLFLPGMIERKKGRILNVASTAGFVPGPFMSIYYATKAFVLSFSEALTNELKGTGVTVTALCPGPTRTGFQKEANVESSRLFSFYVSNAEDVAKAGYKGLMNKKAVVIPGIFNKLLIQSVRFSPRRAVTAVARWMQENRNK